MEPREYSIEQARAVLGDLVIAAMRGETSTIYRYGKPAARLVPLDGAELTWTRKDFMNKLYDELYELYDELYEAWDRHPQLGDDGRDDDTGEFLVVPISSDAWVCVAMRDYGSVVIEDSGPRGTMTGDIRAHGLRTPEQAVEVIRGLVAA